MQVVDRLIVLDKEYYRLTCVGTKIDKERTHTVLIDGSSHSEFCAQNILELAINKEGLFFLF